MKKDLFADYLACTALRWLGPFFRGIPLSWSFFLGRRLGDLVYLFDSRHRQVAYANIRQALGGGLDPRRLAKITRNFYRSFGQNIIEIFLIPVIDQAYLKKYISFAGFQHIEQAFKGGKGIIFLSVHAGSWELSNIITANLGVPFSLLVRDQRYPRLEGLLNSYRSQKGCRFIQRESQLRRTIQALKNKESIGMSLDQGGKTGVLVDFFGKEVSMAQGAVRLALKHDALIIPVFYTRIRGPYIKTIIGAPYDLERSQDLEKDIRDNLQGLVRIFEKYIAQYPQEYLWTYKIWKYGRARRLLILSDRKAGHLRQAEAVSKAIKNIFSRKGISAGQDVIEVKFKNRMAKFFFSAGSAFSGRYNCQGCLGCFGKFLEADTSRALLQARPDIIISCGSGLAAVNSILASESNARSISVMRPGILSTKRFTAVVMPRHDNPPLRKNIIISEGALNLIDEQYLQQESSRLLQAADGKLQADGLYIGLLLGGNTKNFSLDAKIAEIVVDQLKQAAEEHDAGILVTTSRRTPQEIEKLVTDKFKAYPHCKLLIVANENNSPHAVGGILGLSKLVVVSPESISMVSEAASSGRYVFVFKPRGLDRRHRAFLANLENQGYLRLAEAEMLASGIRELLKQSPSLKPLNDKLKLESFLERIL